MACLGAWMASVLVTGSQTPLAEATSALSEARFWHTATLLPDGRVLVTGGASGRSEEGDEAIRDGCELYDPATGRWTAAARMPAARFFHTATLLEDGRVLVVGGSGSRFQGSRDCFLYDPKADRWTATAPLSASRTLHGATLL